MLKMSHIQALLTLTASAGYFAISFYLGTYCSSLGLSSAGELFELYVSPQARLITHIRSVPSFHWGCLCLQRCKSSRRDYHVSCRIRVLV
jgi:hypothetical protein